MANNSLASERDSAVHARTSGRLKTQVRGFAVRATRTPAEERPCPIPPASDHPPTATPGPCGATPGTPNGPCGGSDANARLGGFKSRRQHPIGHHILDFVCLEARLVVGLDGGHPAERLNEDKARTAWLQARGYRVLRCRNTEVLENPAGVLEVMLRALQPPSKPSPCQRGEGTGSQSPRSGEGTGHQKKRGRDRSPPRRTTVGPSERRRPPAGAGWQAPSEAS